MLITILLVMVVDILLLAASGQMLVCRLRPLRILLGALLDGMVSGLMLFSGLTFFSHILWRVATLSLTAAIGIGQQIPGILLFLILHLSLGSLTATKSTIFTTLMGAAGIALACVLVKTRGKLVEVSLRHRGKTYHFTALRDTGNELCDPVSGEPVLIVGETLARELTGLTVQALADPVNSITSLPGLRLIPYQTVGNSGFLLAMRIENAKIGSQQGSALVAFSPQKLGRNYQALTGGMIG